MKKLSIIIALGFTLLASGCYGTTPSKGKQINDCMEKGSPEECDRQINRRSRSY